MPFSVRLIYYKQDVDQMELYAETKYTVQDEYQIQIENMS
jgi:hypothetical protein